MLRSRIGVSALPVVVAAAMSCAAGSSCRAATGGPLQLCGDAELRLSQKDLAEALTLRGASPATGGTPIVVCGLGDGRVEVSLGDRRRQVDLGDRRGSAAARWLALAAADLITQEAKPESLPKTLAPAAAPPPRLLFLFYPSLGLSVAVADTSLLATCVVGASLRLYRSLRWTLDLSYGGNPPTTLHEVEIDLQELPLRSGPALKPSTLPLEFRLSALVVPYWLRAVAAPGVAHYTGVGAGAGAAVVGYLPLHKQLLAVGALGVDVLATHAEFLDSGQPIVDTARFTAWVGAGLAWRSTR